MKLKSTFIIYLCLLNLATPRILLMVNGHVKYFKDNNKTENITSCTIYLTENEIIYVVNDDEPYYFQNKLDYFKAISSEEFKTYTKTSLCKQKAYRIEYKKGETFQFLKTNKNLYYNIVVYNQQGQVIFSKHSFLQLCTMLV
jgi:hypothetical protein